jgi:hypothetical protein
MALTICFAQECLRYGRRQTPGKPSADFTDFRRLDFDRQDAENAKVSDYFFRTWRAWRLGGKNLGQE